MTDVLIDEVISLHNTTLLEQKLSSKDQQPLLLDVFFYNLIVFFVADKLVLQKPSFYHHFIVANEL